MSKWDIEGDVFEIATKRATHYLFNNTFKGDAETATPYSLQFRCVMEHSLCIFHLAICCENADSVL